MAYLVKLGAGGPQGSSPRPGRPTPEPRAEPGSRRALFTGVGVGVAVLILVLVLLSGFLGGTRAPERTLQAGPGTRRAPDGRLLRQDDDAAEDRAAARAAGGSATVPARP